MRRRDNLVRRAAALVRIGRVGTALYLAAIMVGLVGSWACSGFYHDLLVSAEPAVDVPAALLGMQLLVPLGALMASATASDPFVPSNARRLRAVGWALLVLQLLDLPCMLLARFWPSLGTTAPRGDVSVGGWLATLMVFVLARVFEAGTAMRDDLAETV